MLVLTRKLQEQIKIGDEIVVTILQVRGQSVRVGIQAPRNVRVLRAELPVKLPNERAGGDGGANAARIELQPVLPVRKRVGGATGRPLAKKLEARRAPKPQSSNGTASMKGHLGPAIVAFAELAS